MVAQSVQSFLHQHGVQYDVFKHPARSGSYSKAIASHVPPSQMIKSVLLVDLQNQFLLVMIPADRMLSLYHVNKHSHRQFRLADESEISRIFFDCTPGAIPAFGHAYQIETLIDEQLCHKPQLYLEAGDQQQVIQLSQQQFHTLTRNCPRGMFSVFPDICPQFV